MDTQTLGWKESSRIRAVCQSLAITVRQYWRRIATSRFGFCCSTIMASTQEFLLGEFQRTLDERYRLSIPSELGDLLAATSTDCILAKERPGCLSLWSAPVWQARLDDGVELVKQKMRLGKLEERVAEVQLFGRLLSTRHRSVQLAGRGRLVIPEGFREFLGVEPGGEVQILGAAVCVEIWNPASWLKYLERRMPRFRRLFDRLSK
jgi:MraZ protein